MPSAALSTSEPAGPALRAQPVAACTVSRGLSEFELLIEDMEAVIGDRWGDLGFEEALDYLARPEAARLDVVVLALGPADEPRLPEALAVVAAARAREVRVLLVAQDLAPATLHKLLRRGVESFLPYPLPEGELARALRGEDEAGEAAAPRARGDRSGVVIPVYGLAGGTGATTLAVNLAWELALLGPKGGPGPKVCLMDLGLQWGAVATYLDLPRREAVQELLADLSALDGDTLMGALQPHGGKLQVLTAPLDLVPLDLVPPADMARLVETARVNFDYVVLDMPTAVTEWGEAVLQAAHVGFATLALDMRSAQNALRLKRALSAEGLPLDRLRLVLNRAPGRFDYGGRARVRRMAESLGLPIEVQLPDGGRAVAQAGDQGVPLAEGARRNPLRREIRRLAASVHAVNEGRQGPAKG